MYAFGPPWTITNVNYQSFTTICPHKRRFSCNSTHCLKVTSNTQTFKTNPEIYKLIKMKYQQREYLVKSDSRILERAITSPHINTNHFHTS